MNCEFIMVLVTEFILYNEAGKLLFCSLVVRNLGKAEILTKPLNLLKNYRNYRGNYDTRKN